MPKIYTDACSGAELLGEDDPENSSRPCMESVFQASGTAATRVGGLKAFLCDVEFFRQMHSQYRRAPQKRIEAGEYHQPALLPRWRWLSATGSIGARNLSVHLSPADLEFKHQLIVVHAHSQRGCATGTLPLTHQA